tara:strand:+ start:730 stop:975 length:246 start_codon:yes stop_codon:yes gene_type:complete
MALDVQTEVSNLIDYLAKVETLDSISIIKEVSHKLSGIEDMLETLAYEISVALSTAYTSQNEAENAVSEAQEVIDNLEALR